MKKNNKSGLLRSVFDKMISHKLWRKITSVLMALVVFLTTYMMILPALTIDLDTVAEEPGMELAVAGSNADQLVEQVSFVDETAQGSAIAEDGELSDLEITENNTSPEMLGDSQVPQEVFGGEQQEGFVESTEEFGGEQQEGFVESTEEFVEESLDGSAESPEESTEVLPEAFDESQDVFDDELTEDFAENTEEMTDGIPADEQELVDDVTESPDLYIESNVEEIVEEPENEENNAVESASAHVLKAEGEDYRVSVSYTDEAEIPEGAELLVTEILSGEAGYDQYVSEAADTLSTEKRIMSVDSARFFDITIINENETVEPKAPVTVLVELPDSFAADENAAVIHYIEEEAKEIEKVDPVEAAASIEEVEAAEAEAAEAEAAQAEAEVAQAEAAASIAEAETVETDTAQIEGVAELEEDTVQEEINIEETVIPEFAAEMMSDSVESVADTFEEPMNPIAFVTDSFSVYGFVTTTIEKTILASDGVNYKVSVTCGPDAGIPEEADLVVEEITREDPHFEDYYRKALVAAGGITQSLDGVETETTVEDLRPTYARFFDISIMDGEEKIEPKDEVSVNIRLMDAPEGEENGPVVVHFTEEEPVVVEQESESPADVSFVTDSFSVYGVIQYPGTPGSATDLDGRAVKIGINGYYVTSTINSNPPEPDQFSHTNNVGQAPVWYFEAVDASHGQYSIYTSVDGEKKYMNLHRRHENSANAGLSDTPQTFTVSKEGNGYVFSAVSVPDGGTYYLNHWGTTKTGFAGYNGRNSNDDRMNLTFMDVMPNDNKEYMVIVKYNGDYYIVLNDGYLESVEYNEEDNSVTVDDPMMWVYTDNHVYHKYKEVGFNGFQLPSDTYRRYIDPGYEGGLTEENKENTPDNGSTGWGGPVIDEPRPLYAGAQVNYVNNHLQNYQNPDYYLGVQTVDGKLKLKGQVGLDEAVEVYFANAVNVHSVDDLYHTVDHIDVSIKGTAAADVPLAFGKYYDADGNLVMDVEEFQKVHLGADQVVDQSKLTITPQDMMSANITATYNGQPLPNAFYITGYSGNAQHGGTGVTSTAQVRIEGSFEVAHLQDVEPFNGISLYPVIEDQYNTNDAYREAVRQARLSNIVDYSVSVLKEVEFWLQIDDPDNPDEKIQLYDSNNNPLKVKAYVAFSDSFNYWDPKNECPILLETGEEYYYKKTGWYGDYAPWDDWLKGDIARAYSGMDFKLGGESGTGALVYAIEITKIIEDEDGNRINAENFDKNTFTLYRKKNVDTTYDQTYGHIVNVYEDDVAHLDVGTFTEAPDYSEYESVRRKQVSISEEGIGLVYDYDVGPGLYAIGEDPESIQLEITDKAGDSWLYKETRIVTEYARRAPGANNSVHVSDTFIKSDAESGSDKANYAYKSIPEIIGAHWGHNGAEDGPYNNDFLEFYVYNVYQKIPTVDVPVNKEWADFTEDKYDWTVTARLQWAPLYEGQTQPEVAFEDYAVKTGAAADAYDVTITKTTPEADRTFTGLPKYGIDDDGVMYRIIYSLDEVSYSVTDTELNRVIYSFDGTNYFPADPEHQYMMFYPHDAGELSEEDSDYYILATNSKKNTRDHEYIDVIVEKKWLGENGGEQTPDPDWTASFQILRKVSEAHRDTHNMSQEDREADPVTVTVRWDGGSKSIQVQPNVGVRLETVYGGYVTGPKNLSYSVNGVDQGKIVNYDYYNAGSRTDSRTIYPEGNTVITYTGDTDIVIRANLFDTLPGEAQEDDAAWNNAEVDPNGEKTFTLDQTNGWRTTLHLLKSETHEDPAAGQQNIYYYEYYFDELASTPEGYYVTFKDQNGSIITNRSGLVAADDIVTATNRPIPPFYVRKRWRGIPDTTGYPRVTFKLYQCYEGCDNVQNAWVYQGTEYPYENAPSKSYENIPLYSSTNADEDYVWKCPEYLPVTDPNNGRKYAYFVVEDPSGGHVGSTTWTVYGYSQGYAENGTTVIKPSLADQAYNAQIVGNEGTLMIHNKVNSYHEMDIKKQYFMIGAAGSWGNVTANLTRDVVLGFKVIRRIVSRDGKKHYTGWQDYGSEMLVGYSGEGTSTTVVDGVTYTTGTPIHSNEGNDFWLQYAGLWHWTIHENGGDLNSEHIGLPLEGIYVDPNTGEHIDVGYQYSFREVGVYKDLNRTPYPEWEWFSTIVPDRYMNQNGGQVDDEFGIAFPNQDGERVANFQASDLEVTKRWLGAPRAKEVYVKIWRKVGENGTPEDFTEIIAKDVAGDYSDNPNHPANGNSNWQGYVDNTDLVDTENRWLVLRSEPEGWTTHMMIHNALIKSAGENVSDYSYYIEEVGYKDENDVVHLKADDPNSFAALETHYTRWIPNGSDDGAWEVSPSENGADKAIQIGAKGENRLQVMNAPQMDLTVEKLWFRDGNPVEPWQDDITFKIRQESTKWVNGAATGEKATAYVKIGSKDTFTLSSTASENAWWTIDVPNHEGAHSDYTVTVDESATKALAWKFYVDGLYEGYFDADNNEWHCVYTIEEVDTPKSEVIIENNGVSESGQTVTIKNNFDEIASVKITKVFSGVNALPDNFSINAVWTDVDGAHNINLTTGGTQPENVTLTGNGSESSPYVWTISKIKLHPNNSPAINVTFTESGFMFEDDMPAVTVTSTTDANVNNTHPTTVVKVLEDEIAEGNFTNTYVSDGALKITKLVRINGNEPTQAQYSQVDRSYTFSVVGPTYAEAQEQITRYVQIDVSNGVMASYKLADANTEAAWNNATEVEVTAESIWALVPDLDEGDYVVTELPVDGMYVSEITGGKMSGEPGDEHNDADTALRTVTVHVTAGDTTGDEAGASVEYTNNKTFVDIKVIKIDETTRKLETQTKLPTAQFQLSRYTANEGGTSGKYTGYPNAQDSIKTTSAKTGDDYGTLTYGSLPDGQYKISELKSPDGYILTQDNDIYFDIVQGEVTRYAGAFNGTARDTEAPIDDSDKVIAEISEVALITYSKATGTDPAAFTVGNEPGAALPNTGGPGTNLLYLLGSMLTMLAGAGFILLYRKKRAG